MLYQETNRSVRLSPNHIHHKMMRCESVRILPHPKNKATNDDSSNNNNKKNKASTKTIKQNRTLTPDDHRLGTTTMTTTRRVGVVGMLPLVSYLLVWSFVIFHFANYGAVVVVVDAFCCFPYQTNTHTHCVSSIQSKSDRRRYARVIRSMTTTVGSSKSSARADSILLMTTGDGDGDPTSSSSSSTTLDEEKTSPSSSNFFNEQSYEQERLEKDRQAMSVMEEEALTQYSKLRTPWKWELRRKIWDYMESNDIAEWPRPVHHRIPNFKGAQQAATRLASLEEFRAARLVKVNPDTPQRHVRHLVLESNKTLLTPQPRLRTGFFSTIKMDALPSQVEIEDCTTSKGVAKYGTPVTLDDKSYKVDMVVVGSTAVCPRTGARVGKGEGFAELEWGILTEQGNLDSTSCLVVTTVHDCQVIDRVEDMPRDWKLTKHDVPVDIIVTPTRIIRVNDHENNNTQALPKPSGIYWDLLSPQKLSQIKVLRQLKDEIQSSTSKTLPVGPDEVLPPVAKRSPRRPKSKSKSKKKPQQEDDGCKDYGPTASIVTTSRKAGLNAHTKRNSLNIATKK